MKYYDAYILSVPKYTVITESYVNFKPFKKTYFLCAKYGLPIDLVLIYASLSISV